MYALNAGNPRRSSIPWSCKRLVTAVLFGVSLNVLGCTSDESQTAGTSDVISGQDVREAMGSYMDAINSADVERAITHYADDPEFTVISDGQIFGYSEWVSSVRTQWSTIENATGSWDTVHVTVLGENTAIAYAPYELTFVDTSGASSPHNGVVSWIWIDKGGALRMIHGHARNEGVAEQH